MDVGTYDEEYNFFSKVSRVDDLVARDNSHYQESLFALSAGASNFPQSKWAQTWSSLVGGDEGSYRPKWQAVVLMKC